MVGPLHTEEDWNPYASQKGTEEEENEEKDKGPKGPAQKGRAQWEQLR